MKLNSLYVDDYKLLKNFSINFSKDISILIGINGSGKSSILEIIAQIFSDSILGRKSKFGFKINYELRLEEILEQTAITSEFRTDYIEVEISALKQNAELAYKVYLIDVATDERIVLEKRDEIEKRFNSFVKIFPSNIVIYYSGFSDIMKGICAPHDHILAKQYREGNTTAHRPFFYFEPALFDIILFSLLSYEYGDVPDFLLNRAKIKYLQNVQIRLKKPAWVTKQKIINWWDAKGELAVFKKLLEAIITEKKNNDLTVPRIFPAEGNISIDYLNDENIIISIVGQTQLFQIREYFLEEKALFKLLNSIYIDGFLNSIDFSFVNIDDYSFNSLSEGEQQAITVKGLTELVTGDNTLFLFDEPDTYLHPLWQRSFIESIINFTRSNSNVLSQFLITTHSPQLLSNANPQESEVHIMEDGEVIKVIPKYYGRDISTILYEMMGVERRNKKVTKALSVLFNLIEDEELEKAKDEYSSLANLLGDDDPAIIRAKTQLDYLEEAKNEADN